MIAEVLSGLLGVLDALTGHQAQHNERARVALQTLFTAISETRLYLADLDARRRRNRAIERDLSRLWTRAAIAVRPIDRAFAKRCLSKAEYWVMPTRWREDDIVAASIGFNEVYIRARELLVRW